jgi:YbbR domain-containing protein
MISFLRELFLKDFWLKLTSFVVAVLIWFTVAFAIRHEVSPVGNLTLTAQQMTFFNVPVVVLSAASDVHDFRVDPKTVTVTVQGEPRFLDRIETKDIRAMIDLTGIEAGKDLRKRIAVSTPAGVTHVRVTPEDVKVILPSSGQTQ